MYTTQYYQDHSDLEPLFLSATKFESVSFALMYSYLKLYSQFNHSILGQITGPENKASCLLPVSILLAKSSSHSSVYLTSAIRLQNWWKKVIYT